MIRWSVYLLTVLNSLLIFMPCNRFRTLTILGCVNNIWRREILDDFLCWSIYILGTLRRHNAVQRESLPERHLLTRPNVISYRIAGCTEPDGVQWFWIGSHEAYNKVERVIKRWGHQKTQVPWACRREPQQASPPFDFAQGTGSPVSVLSWSAWFP